MKLDPDSLVAAAKTAAAPVNPVRQRTQYTCMATSMMMCLNANGMEVDEDEVNRVMGARAMHGASWEDAIACAQHYGMRATLICPATVRQLKELTDRGVPVMIAWNPEGRDWSHASVVFDVDDDLNVHVADPNIPDPDETVRVVPKADFYGKWSEKWPNYLVRRPAMAIEREITPDGRQVVASQEPRNMNVEALVSAFSGRTADADSQPIDEETVSKIHTEMKQALARVINGSKAYTDDFWTSVVQLPREITDGMYVQAGTQVNKRKNQMEANISIWMPMSARGNDWKPLYAELKAAMKKARAAMGKFGLVKALDLQNNFKLWLEVPADKVQAAAQGLPQVAGKVGASLNAILRDAAKKPRQASAFDNYPEIHPAIEAKHQAAETPAKAKETWETKMTDRSKSATDDLWTGLGDFHPEVERMFQASDDEDDDKDKEGKFEKGKSVPVSKLPKELQKNVEDPPESVEKLKDKLEKKGADKEAATTPGGLYGYPKKVQADCEASARKLQKMALKLASDTVKRDAKVAQFWGQRAKKAKSGTSKMLLAALEANQKFAASQGRELEAGVDKEAAATGYGYYGFRAKTANRAFMACLLLKEAAGEIAADLHRRRAGQHERITGFLKDHAKAGKCTASKMLLHAYPEASAKLASGPSDPTSVEAWLEFEPEG